MQEIERANPDTLFRVFGAADWGNREKCTDELLKDLIEGFSSIELGDEVVSTDVLGDAYEYPHRRKRLRGEQGSGIGQRRVPEPNVVWHVVSEVAVSPVNASADMAMKRIEYSYRSAPGCNRGWAARSSTGRRYSTRSSAK